MQGIPKQPTQTCFHFLELPNNFPRQCRCKFLIADANLIRNTARNPHPSMRNSHPQLGIRTNNDKRGAANNLDTAENS
jgi:hypothetical protein